MSFNPRYSSIPMVSDNIGTPDLPIIFPNGVSVPQHLQGDTLQNLYAIGKGGEQIPFTFVPGAPTYSVTMDADYKYIALELTGDLTPSLSLPFVVEPSVYPKKEWCRILASDTTKYNYPTRPIVVFFKASQRKIEQQNVVVKYDDEVGTIIPLSQKQFDVLTFTTQPMNNDYARLLLDVAEWDNVTFQYWDTKNNAWSTSINVVKKAEAWQKTTYPKTLGTTIQGSFIIKQ